MTRYWIKIVVGALLIFAVGMVAWYGVRKGVRTVQMVHTVLESSDPITIPLKFVNFRVDGAEVGKLQQLRLIRSAPKVIEGVQVTVRVDSAAVLDRLRNCTLRLDDVENLDENSTFVCVTPEHPGAAGDFTQFGQVLVDGSDLVLPLLLPAKTVRDIKHQGWQNVDSAAAPVIPPVPEVPSAPANPGASGTAPATP
jgi:hypothetical protein